MNPFILLDGKFMVKRISFHPPSRFDVLKIPGGIIIPGTNQPADSHNMTRHKPMVDLLEVLAFRDSTGNNLYVWSLDYIYLSSISYQLAYKLMSHSLTFHYVSTVR